MPAVANHYAVAVIGSGPVGLTLTNLLGVLGVRTLIVERNTRTVQEPRAVSIDDESLRTMQAAGVVADVLPTIVPGYGSHYFSPNGTRFAKVEPTGRPYGFPRRNAFRQPILEAQLKDALARFDHVDTLYGWELSRYAQDARAVTIDLIGPGTERQTLTCDYLVGCDGAASRVRDQQGVLLEGTTFDQRWLILDLENNQNVMKHAEVFCDTRRPCIALPGPDDTRRFEFKLLDGETDQNLLDSAKVEELLRTHHADPNATLRRKVVYRFHARVAPRWSFDRVFLAGDAAHLTPPFAGQGMNSGIRDAMNLSWKLASVLKGVAGPGLLDTYEQERKDHIWQMIGLALRMGHIMSPRSRWRGALTQAAFRMLNLWPTARDYIAEMKYKPPPRFTSGFQIPDDKGRNSLIGRMLPQPMVRTVDGREMLLDSLLGTGFALVRRASQPREPVPPLDQPVWDRLGVTRIRLLPAGLIPRAIEGVEVAAEASGELDQALTHYPDCVLLVRPDRYVAASVPLRDADAASRAVEALLDATWRGREGSGRPAE